MPRPPSPESRQVRILTYLDTMPYELPNDQSEFDLLMRTHLTGPLREPVPEPPPGRRIKRTGIETEETLELRSKNVMAEDDITRIFVDLESGKTVQIQMEFAYFSSDWNDDQDLNDLDLSGRITLRYDKLERICVDAQFDQDWLVGFGANLVSKQLDGQTIGHFDLRLWHILSHLSPQLDKELRASVGKATAPLRYPLVETLQAAVGEYRFVGPPVGSTVQDNRYRDGLLNALAEDATVYSAAQICVIFGKESVDDLDPTTEGNLFHDARDITINRMIAEAGLKPVFRKFYDSRQITHILVPFAVAHREDKRYADLKDELIDSGISVPDSPMT